MKWASVALIARWQGFTNATAGRHYSYIGLLFEHFGEGVPTEALIDQYRYRKWFRGGPHAVG